MAFGHEAPQQHTQPDGASAHTLAFLKAWDTPGLALDWDDETRTITSWLTHEDRPAMTPQVMAAHHELLTGLQRNSWAGCDWFRFYVNRARSAKVYSYGGDFAFMLRVAETRDATAMGKYGKMCIQAIHKLIEGLGDRTISIAAVGGTCLGGGLEGAVAHDFVVAERGKKMGLPEGNIGMFPGAGAYSMLSRKIGRRETERLITKAAYFTTDEAHEMGMVDHLCDAGQIETGIRELQEEITPRFNTYLSTVRARRRCAEITMTEMQAVIDDWVDAGMTMEAHHLMLMRHLLAQQDANARRAAEKAKAAEAGVVAMDGGETPTQKANPFRASADA